MSVLSLRQAPPERLDFLNIAPATLAALSPAEAERLPIGTTRRGLVLGDCFQVSLDGGDSLTIEGGHERLDRVGGALAAGTIRVVGDVGQRLGEGMAGGTLTVTGTAGPFAGTGATGGTITIAGDAGDYAGGAVYAAKAGLDGATLVIKGTAGRHLGDRMRRGLILVERAGDYAGSRMIAGTIAAGSVGDDAGYGMRRGTLLLGSHGRLTPTFVETGEHDLVFLRLLARSLKTLSPRHAEIAAGPLRRYSGDLATIAKGEIWAAA
ncbi:formylmethanofuran dehydrogenase subunit C [Methylobacterium sp. E-041]|nr:MULTISPECIES: formylmethanofuran dehydrogenase subunit C [unclassified Methylobacterium]MCJ2076806.1 formylmethanofuran dehydrogenase subunit C [Methylobacterium sp. E-016]MCJ2104332.1 formylmethanofuran dehydrogenase subunit C [Methylobacterium sp. E-041]TXN39091.1 formylmethanofuran dehydrogenase subunit C [Methylobacterium sp. WL93]TXN52633.1 formylmethanofuran dehydrogenase subunit C [Methylobacterium sp. WL119]TXN70003.1 formylmethanofuran dehydrogenase subunit C [Methylobacterium sp. 